jgi:hypothetical protein
METLIDASKEVCLEVNTEKTKYMLLSHHQNAGKIYDIKMANTCYENVAKFRCLGTTITNQNLIQEEIKRRLNLGNACYHSGQNLCSLFIEFATHHLQVSVCFDPVHPGHFFSFFCRHNYSWFYYFLLVIKIPIPPSGSTYTHNNLGMITRVPPASS